MSRKVKPKTFDWLIKKYMDFFQKFGMDEENIRIYYDWWKDKHSESIEDFLWHIFNHLLSENASQSKDIEGFYERNRKIYSEMLQFRRIIEGKKANEILQLLHQTDIALRYEQTSLDLDAGVVGHPDCSVSQELKDKRFSIRDAIKADVIPYERCTREKGCACTYTFHPKRDSEGRLINKKESL